MSENNLGAGQAATDKDDFDEAWGAPSSGNAKEFGVPDDGQHYPSDFKEPENAHDPVLDVDAREASKKKNLTSLLIIGLAGLVVLGAAAFVLMPFYKHFSPSEPASIQNNRFSDLPASLDGVSSLPGGVVVGDPLAAGGLASVASSLPGGALVSLASNPEGAVEDSQSNPAAPDLSAADGATPIMASQNVLQMGAMKGVPAQGVVDAQLAGGSSAVVDAAPSGANLGVSPSSAAEVICPVEPKAVAKKPATKKPASTKAASTKKASAASDVIAGASKERERRAAATAKKTRDKERAQLQARARAAVAASVANAPSNVSSGAASVAAQATTAQATIANVTRPESRTAKASSVEGYRLMAIWPRTGEHQQATVKDAAGANHVLRTGDTLAGVRIKSINAHSFFVETEAGFIR